MTFYQVRPKVVAFVGATRRPSRSRHLAEAIAEALERQLPIDLAILDILDAGPTLGGAYVREALAPEARAVVEAIEGADALIAVSPVYKGSYTGLFKHVFDFVAADALVNVPVAIGATGGGHRHALIVEHQLRPLFGFFSAQTVPTAVYASDHEFDGTELIDASVRQRIALAGAQLALLLAARLEARSGHEGIVIAHPEDFAAIGDGAAKPPTH